MSSTAYSLHGRALLDCFRGDANAMLVCRQDGVRDDVPASFWLRESLDPLERLALARCRGRVLDAGAGSGLHALELQRRGLGVVAIDIASECVAVMRERGVREVLVADLFEYDGGPFDTVLCLCNGLDKVERLENLPRFFDRMRGLVAPGGQLLADSFDLRVGADATRLAELGRKTSAGRYFGELTLEFEYQTLKSGPFTTLQVDFDTLHEVAEACGWATERLYGDAGHYLARATPR